MSHAATVCLRFGTGIAPVIQGRLRYAFSVFAAVYNHPVVEPDGSGEPICLTYGCSPDEVSGSAHIRVPARYKLRPQSEVPPPPATHRFAGQDFYLFFGVDEHTGQPDWLAEIFEWLSSSYEISRSGRDDISRIPFSETLFARYQISPRKPHASMLMAWLASTLPNTQTGEPLPKPPSAIPDTRHLIVCSHDIDFYYTDRLSALVRLLKNLVISVRMYRSWSFFHWNASKLLNLLRGEPVAAYLPALLQACQANGVQSTVFVVGRRLHRKDPNYTLEQLVPALQQSCKNGFSVGVHGSYQSIVETRDLHREVAAISAALGKRPLGGRQHYLRFDRHEKLFSGIQQAGLYYDSTLGFADNIGFRNGACFAFPPYDFSRERAYDFLEIPLVLMDGSLEVTCRQSGESEQTVAAEVLQASREWGWGGISLDWHNPLEPIQVPSRVNEVFWECQKDRDVHKERWIDGDQFLRLCLGRYQSAGLLQSVRADA
jgi:peptidoglycan/xylan/chitin deacetylase (PgdA/CDA1 family)